MTHQEIQSREIAESYVRGRLSDAERTAFEDHCYACDECFDQVRTLQTFVDGVRDAAKSGLLPEPRQAAPPFRLAFVLACAACLILAVTAGWIALVERPRLEAEAARQRQAAEADRKRLAALENDLAGMKLAQARVPAPLGNLPLVMLDASRADSSSAITLPASASQLALWVEPPRSARGATYRLEISGPAGAQSIDGLTRNSYGAIAASLPAASLTAGKYRARLYLTQGAKPELAGEYHFDIRR